MDTDGRSSRGMNKIHLQNKKETKYEFNDGDVEARVRLYTSALTEMRTLGITLCK